MRLAIRTLTWADLEAAGAIVMAAFGSPYDRTDEVRRYLALQSDGWLLATVDDRPVGTVGALDYGPYAYISLLAVHPSIQRRGIGLTLMEHILAWLDARGCPMALLDATDYGAPLYRRLGFVEDDGTLVLGRDAGAVPPHTAAPAGPLQPMDLPALARFDAPIFGATREAVLASYLADAPERAFVARDAAGQMTGYLFAQARALGPWVARVSANAEALLATALALPFASAPEVVVPASNALALSLLKRHGFHVTRSLRHMRRGGHAVPSRRTLIYGQASLAIG
jgi:ribosomal protein S18 acetylase RimI-like enzyme